MTDYVAGFLFCRNDTEVLVVQKKFPAWQDGLVNGIGGKVEGMEGTDAAMAREFREETGLQIEPWTYLATEHGPDYTVSFYHHHLAPGYRPTPPVANDVGEILGWMRIDDLFIHPHLRPIGNLRWLIPLALDWRRPCIGHLRVDRDIKEQPWW